jgi:hypothetical protein
MPRVFNLLDIPSLRLNIPALLQFELNQAFYFASWHVINVDCFTRWSPSCRNLNQSETLCYEAREDVSTLAVITLKGGTFNMCQYVTVKKK